MIPMILMAIEDDADRAFMINLYEQCHKAMYRQAYDILRDHGEAEDAVQDTLIKLIGRMAALRAMPQGQLLPYAVIAAKSTAIDRWRRRKKERVGASEDFAEGWSAAPEEQLGAFIDMERVDLLSRGLEKLPQRDRDIVDAGDHLGEELPFIVEQRGTHRRGNSFPGVGKYCYAILCRKPHEL